MLPIRSLSDHDILPSKWHHVLIDVPFIQQRTNMSLGAANRYKDNEIPIFKDIYFIIKNTIHSWNASLVRFGDMQKISTHVVEVSSKLIKDITHILHHNGLLIMTINEICVIQNNLITSGQT